MACDITRAKDSNHMIGDSMHIENTLASILAGMDHFDGTEFDIRLTSDRNLAIYHDRRLHPTAKKVLGGTGFVEHYTGEQLQSVGIPLLEDLLSSGNFLETWKSQPKLVDIEMKLPYPGAGLTRGWFSSKGPREHLSSMYEILGEVINRFEVPVHNLAVLAFSNQLLRARQNAGMGHLPSTVLRPCIQPWGGPLIERIRAGPAFFFHPFKRSLATHQREGSPFLPMSLNYLLPHSRWVVFGRSVGLYGKPAIRLGNLRQGFPVQVFPSRLQLEWRMRDLGISLICDESPEFVPLDHEGVPRWTRPATQSLTLEDESELRKTRDDYGLSEQQRLSDEVEPWHLKSAKEQVRQMKEWSERWKWKRPLDDLMAESSDDRLPWEVVRVIGHRGSGASNRPIPKLV